MVFVDTNVFFYSQDDRYPSKQRRCRQWLSSIAAKGLCRANLQVANEFAHVVFRRMPELDEGAVYRLCDQILEWGRSEITYDTIMAARGLKRRYRYSWWNCILLASALELGCSHFLSEDLQDGQVVTDSSARSLTIVDPFVHSPSRILTN